MGGDEGDEGDEVRGPPDEDDDRPPMWRGRAPAPEPLGVDAPLLPPPTAASSAAPVPPWPGPAPSWPGPPPSPIDPVAPRLVTDLRAGVTTLDVIAAWIVALMCFPIGLLVAIPIISGRVYEARTARLMLGGVVGVGLVVVALQVLIVGSAVLTS